MAAEGKDKVVTRDEAEENVKSGDITNLAVYRSPQQIIWSDGKQLHFDESVVKEVQRIDRQLIIISIVGTYRSGKSYLMNQLANHCGESASPIAQKTWLGRSLAWLQRSESPVNIHNASEFKVGSKMTAETQGIWVWVRKHPTSTRKCIMLMDSEGLGDPHKGDNVTDKWNFCITTLLASVLVYNDSGKIDEQSLQGIAVITSISKTILVDKEDPQQNELLHEYFPRFVYVVRDFSLTIEYDGEAISMDDYLEDCLKISKSQKKNKESDDIKKCIRKYFRERKCFTLGFPAESRHLKNLSTLKEPDIFPDFKKGMTSLCQYLVNESPVKSASTEYDQPYNGSMWCDFAKKIVDAANSGEVFVLDNTLRAVYSRQNEVALLEASAYYKKHIQQVKLPVDDSILFEKHGSLLGHAFSKYNDLSVSCNQKENENQQDKLTQMLTKVFEEARETNLKTYQDDLWDILKASDINRKLENREYMKIGGYEEYQEDLEKLKRKFDPDQTSQMKREIWAKYEKDQALDAERIKRKGETEMERQQLMIRRQFEKEMAEKEGKEKYQREQMRRLQDKMERETRERERERERETERQRQRQREREREREREKQKEEESSCIVM